MKHTLIVFMGFMVSWGCTSQTFSQYIQNENDFLIGVHTHITRGEDYAYDNEFAQRDSLFDIIRITNFDLFSTGFKWEDIEPKPGKWNWKITDEIVSKANNNGIKVLAMVHGLPNWARPLQNHLEDWNQFISELGKRYKGQDIIWQLGEEPDLDKKMPPQLFVKLVKNSYDILKRIDPDNRIIIGGLSSQQSAMNYFERMLKLNALEYCDGLSVHPYRYLGEQTIDYLDEYKQLMSQYSTLKPIFITAYGVSAWRNNIHPSKSDVIADLIQKSVTQTFQSSEGVEAFFIKSTIDNPILKYLMDQLEERGWPIQTLDLSKRADRNTLLKKNTGILILPARDALPEDRLQFFYDYIENGGLLVSLGGLPLSAYAAKANKNGKPQTRYSTMYTDKLNIAYSKINTGRTMEKITVRNLNSKLDNNNKSGYSNSTNIGKKSDAVIYTSRLLNAPKARNVKYVPLLSAFEKGQYLGDIASLYQYPNTSIKGALLVVSAHLELGVSYESQKNMIGKSLLSAWAGGAQSFIVFELIDKEFDKLKKYYGIFEHSLKPKPSYHLLSELITTVSQSNVQEYTKTSDGLIIKFYNVAEQATFYIGWGQTFINRMKEKKLATKPYYSSSILISE